MDNLAPTQEQLDNLKKLYDQLSPLRDEFHFWTIELNQELSDEKLLELPEFTEKSTIYPETEEQIVEYNSIVWERAKLLAKKHTLYIPGEDVFEFETEKESLDNELKDATNPLAILIQKKEWLKAQVKRYEEYNIKDFRDLVHVNYQEFKKTNWRLEVPSFWLTGYEDYYFRSKEPNLSYGMYNAAILLAWNNGYEIAKYHEYIDKKIMAVSKKQTSIAQEETSLKRQLLRLFYTGYIKKLEEEIETVKERSKFLAELLNRSEQNVKTILIHINHPSSTYGIKTIENLQSVLESFEQAGLNEEAKKVNADLDTLKLRK